MGEMSVEEEVVSELTVSLIFNQIRIWYVKVAPPVTPDSSLYLYHSLRLDS